MGCQVGLRRDIELLGRPEPSRKSGEVYRGAGAGVTFSWKNTVNPDRSFGWEINVTRGKSGRV